MVNAIQIVAFLITFLGAGVILRKAKPVPNYWPAMKILATMIFVVMFQVLLIYALVPWYPNLRTDPVQIIARAIFMSFCTLWATALVIKRNRTPPSRQIDLVGKESPITDEELALHQEAVQRSGERHGRFDYDHWYARLDAQAKRRAAKRKVHV